MLRRLALALALVASAGIAAAAPTRQDWECTAQRVWPPASSGLAADTLTRLTYAGTTDSIDVTDSVYVFNARYVLLVAFGSATDSLALPLLQSRLPNGQWNGSAGTSFLPWSGFTPASGLASITAPVNTTGRGVWGVYNETTVGGSTPLPMVNDYFRWRVASGDLRRYSGAAATGLVATGNYTLIAFVWR